MSDIYRIFLEFINTFCHVCTTHTPEEVLMQPNSFSTASHHTVDLTHHLSTLVVVVPSLNGLHEPCHAYATHALVWQIVPLRQ